MAGASLAGLIRDGGNDLGNDIGLHPSWFKGVRSSTYANQTAVCRANSPAQF